MTALLGRVGLGCFREPGCAPTTSHCRPQWDFQACILHISDPICALVSGKSVLWDPAVPEARLRSGPVLPRTPRRGLLPSSLRPKYLGSFSSGSALGSSHYCLIPDLKGPTPATQDVACDRLLICLRFLETSLTILTTWKLWPVPVRLWWSERFP